MHADQLEQVTQQNTVVVQGEATIVVQPDLAKISLAVETKDADSKKAQAENTKIMNAVMKALEEAGVAKDNISTSYYNIYQAFDYDNPVYVADQKEDYALVYYVSNGITIKTSNIDEVGKLIDVATAAGANNIEGINFETSKADEYYQQALKDAMQSAKAKADAITATFGKTVDIPLKVSEVGGAGSYNRNFYAEKVEMAADSTTPIQPGGLKIRATVTVEYGY